MGLREWLSGSGSRVGLYVDGPNVLRDEFDVDLDDLRERARTYGQPAVTRLYLNERAPADLVRAAEARGYAVVTTSTDVDVHLAIDAAAAAADGAIDVLVVVSRDADFKPLLELAARRGLETVAVAPGVAGRSDALQNAAQHAETIGEP
ncbi:MAG: NYN domain-containing protein [Salinirussus sp.]